MERERFESLVAEAVDDLPAEFKEMLDNVDVVVEDFPNPDQLDRADVDSGHIVLGLYEGVPLTERTSYYGLVPPDKISIFRRNIEKSCGTDELKIIKEIQATVRHEIAHHFGIGDERLAEIENERD